MRSARLAAERDARAEVERAAAVLFERQRSFADAWRGCVVALDRGVVDRKRCGEMYRAFDRLERTPGWPGREMVKR